MPEETITNAELARQISGLRLDLHEDLNDLKTEVAKLVPREVYDAHRAGFEQRFSALEKSHHDLSARHREQEEQRRNDRRYIVTAIVIPVLAIVVQILLATKGVKL